MQDLLSRLLSRCERQPFDCLDWTGATNNRNYGRINIDGQPKCLHRLMWELHHGPIPSGLHCLHSCDRPICCEIGHLRLGTNQDNMDERNAKGRQARGGATNRTSLTAFHVWQVRKIIALRRFSNQEIAELFGVDASAIRCIRVGRTWAWLRDNPTVPISHLIPPSTFRRREVSTYAERWPQ
jgi:hypothetical protein